MKSEEKFLKDCESICFDCGSSNFLIKKHEGVSLCFKCYIIDLFDNIIYWFYKMIG